jgi:vacuolar-type H+-ATPase subunit H
MDTEKIAGEVATVVRDLVARTISQAEGRAAEIVDAAEAEAKSLIEEAEAKARTLLERAEAEAGELRRHGERDAEVRMAAVRNAFAEMQSKIGLGGEVLPGPVTTPEPQPPSVPEPTPEPPSPSPSPDPTPEPEPPLIPEPTPPPDEGTPPQISVNGNRSADSSGARLVAMNMALEGASRGDIVALLSTDYELEDAGKLVDEVLVLAGK